jgi:hypothetical protein
MRMIHDTSKERSASGRAAGQRGTGSSSIETTLPYVAPREGLHFTHVLDDRQSNLNLRPETVLVRNARELRPGAALTAEGFTVIDRPTAFTEFLDLAQLHTRYAAEVLETVREVSGAAKVVGVPPAVRITDPQERQRQRYIPDAARHLHLDYSGASMRDHLVRFAGISPDEIDKYSCVRIYNTWRSLSPPPQDVPLALCDVRSVKDEDVHIVKAYYPVNDIGYIDIQVLDYNQAHKWWFYPDLSADELLIFCGGELHRPPAGVFHGAFDNPALRGCNVPRASVEMRTFALFH